MKKFKTETQYKTRSACDQNATWTFTVLSRTAKTVKLQDESGAVVTKRVKVWNDEETCLPLGSYSMAPILRAGNVVEEECKKQDCVTYRTQTVMGLPIVVESGTPEAFMRRKRSRQAQKKYYSQRIEMPKNKQEGLSNFVQMIINELEDGNYREALLKAVDLKNDIGSAYTVQ